MKKFKKIYIEITNICNLNCKFCPKDNLVKKQMSLDEFESILKKIDNHTDYLYLHVKGEPLLHSNFKEILELCNKYNKKVNITTNGTLLKERISDILKSCVRQINISLQSVINENAIDDIIECSDQLSENNIQVVLRNWVSNQFDKEIKEKIKNHYNVDSYDKDIKLKENLYFNSDEEFIWPDMNNNFINKVGTCYGLRTHIGILVDGTVIPCCLDSKGIINLGNIFKEDLDNILNKERSKNIKENFQNNKLCEELCQKCGYREKI